MIEYEVYIKDEFEGDHYTLGVFEDVEVAVYNAKKLDENLVSVLVSDLGLRNIDPYHMDHPHKRFDVVIEVNYD